MSIQDQMLSDNADEGVQISEMVRSGEASRLRRRGAIHGHAHHHPRPPYVTLTCGVEKSWEWVSLPEPSPVIGTERKPLPPPIQFKSSGCEAVVTRRAAPSRFHQLFEVSPPLNTDAVAPLDAEYLDDEQRELVESMVQSELGELRWEALGCRVCGNVLGFQYRTRFWEESRSQIMFFPTAVTSLTHCDFSEAQHSRVSHQVEGISSPSRSPRRLRSNNRSSPADIRLAYRTRIMPNGHHDSSYSSQASSHYAQSLSSSDFFDWYTNARVEGLAPLSDDEDDDDDEDERATVVETELDHGPDNSDDLGVPDRARYWTEPLTRPGWDRNSWPENVSFPTPVRPLVLPSVVRTPQVWRTPSSISEEDEQGEDSPIQHHIASQSWFRPSSHDDIHPPPRTPLAASHPPHQSHLEVDHVNSAVALEPTNTIPPPDAVVILEPSDLPSVPASPPQSNPTLDIHTPPLFARDHFLRTYSDGSSSTHATEQISRMYALRTPVETPGSTSSEDEVRRDQPASNDTTSTPTTTSATTPPPRPPRGADPRFRTHAHNTRPLAHVDPSHGFPRPPTTSNALDDDHLHVRRAPARRGRSRESSPASPVVDHGQSQRESQSRSWRARHDPVTRHDFWRNSPTQTQTQQDLRNEISTDSSSSISTSNNNGLRRPNSFMGFRDGQRHAERFRPDLRRSNSLGRALSPPEVFPARPVFVRTPVRRMSISFIPPPPSELAGAQNVDGEDNAWLWNGAEQDGSEDKDDEASPARGAGARRH